MRGPEIVAWPAASVKEAPVVVVSAMEARKAEVLDLPTMAETTKLKPTAGPPCTHAPRIA